MWLKPIDCSVGNGSAFIFSGRVTGLIGEQGVTRLFLESDPLCALEGVKLYPPRGCLWCHWRYDGASYRSWHWVLRHEKRKLRGGCMWMGSFLTWQTPGRGMLSD